MEFEIRFESNALFDIEEAIEYYESQQKGLGIRFKTQQKSLKCKNITIT
ncbi:hypothetical protein [Mesonia aquimarina]|nr:hypothetical protein [Mesonia aquimarina]